jgi:hypothetical protein
MCAAEAQRRQVTQEAEVESARPWPAAANLGEGWPAAPFPPMAAAPPIAAFHCSISSLPSSAIAVAQGCT